MQIDGSNVNLSNFLGGSSSGGSTSGDGAILAKLLPEELMDLPIGSWIEARMLAVRGSLGMILVDGRRVQVIGNSLPSSGTQISFRIAQQSGQYLAEIQTTRAVNTGDTGDVLRDMADSGDQQVAGSQNIVVGDKFALRQQLPFGMSLVVDSDKTAAGANSLSPVAPEGAAAAGTHGAPGVTPDAIAVSIIDGRLPAGAKAGQMLSATVIGASADKAVLDMGGQRLSIQTPVALMQDQSVTVRVVQVSPNALVELVNTAGDLKAAAAVTLVDGQRVGANVVEQTGPERFVLEVQGALLEVEGKAMPRVGTQLVLQVRQTPAGITFHVVDVPLSPQRAAEAIVQNAASVSSTPAESFQILQQLLAQYVQQPAVQLPGQLAGEMANLLARIQQVLPTSENTNAGTIGAFATDSGVLYEAKLFDMAETMPDELAAMANGDIKALLMRVAAQVQTLGPSFEGAGELLDRVGEQLSHIETQQAANIVARTNYDASIIDVPLLVSGQICNARLSVNPDSSQKDPAQAEADWPGYAILLLLELPRLGAVRIDAHISQESLNARFYLDKPESLAIIKGQMGEFREALYVMGYERIYLAAELLDKISPQRRNRFDMLSTPMPEAVNQVDTLK